MSYHIPLELQAYIISLCSLESMCNLALVSRFCLQEAENRMYSHIEISLHPIPTALPPCLITLTRVESKAYMVKSFKISFTLEEMPEALFDALCVALPRCLVNMKNVDRLALNIPWENDNPLFQRLCLSLEAKHGHMPMLRSLRELNTPLNILHSLFPPLSPHTFSCSICTERFGNDIVSVPVLCTWAPTIEDVMQLPHSPAMITLVHHDPTFPFASLLSLAALRIHLSEDLEQGELGQFFLKNLGRNKMRPMHLFRLCLHVDSLNDILRSHDALETVLETATIYNINIILKSSANIDEIFPDCPRAWGSLLSRCHHLVHKVRFYLTKGIYIGEEIRGVRLPPSFKQTFFEGIREKAPAIAAVSFWDGTEVRSDML